MSLSASCTQTAALQFEVGHERSMLTSPEEQDQRDCGQPFGQLWYLTMFYTASLANCNCCRTDSWKKIKSTWHFKTKSLILSFYFHLYYVLQKGLPFQTKHGLGRLNLIKQQLLTTFQQTYIIIITRWCFEPSKPQMIISGLKTLTHDIGEILANTANFSCKLTEHGTDQKHQEWFKKLPTVPV